MATRLRIHQAVDEATLREALFAHPFDEAPWLIYADWLEDRGDPHAALFRRRFWTHGLGMSFTLVPRGSFWMSQEEVHAQTFVEIKQNFYLGRHLITQAQWHALMGKNPSAHSSRGRRRRRIVDYSPEELAQLPVENVSWDHVQEFLSCLNKYGQDRQWAYRLPTEAEWEYSCRGAMTSPEDCSFDYYFDQPTSHFSANLGNFDDRDLSGYVDPGSFRSRPSKVGSYPPNRLGLYDMHGNVWEWCQDRFHPKEASRVIRGGSCVSDAEGCRAATRANLPPSVKSDYVGFRVLCVPVGPS